MKRKFLIKIIPLLIFAATSCRKDPMVYADSDCYDLHYNTVNTAINYSQPDTGHSFGRFNPNNSDEICYFLGIHSTNTTEIKHRNLSSNSETLVFSGLVWSFMSYSSNDWLIFNYSGNNLWKVKTNGDSLTQLTFDGQSLEPHWNNNGQQYIFRQDIGSTHRTIICDKNGQHIDTLSGFYWHNGSWSRDNNLLVSIDYDNLITYSFSSGAISTISGHGQGNSSKDGILDVTISPDSRKIYWCNGWGIFYQNISTGQTGQIATSCDARRFNSIDISADGQKLLCTSYNEKMLDYNTNSVFIETKMYLMNVDGSNRHEINF
jgi:hypothetical protein